MKRIWNLLLITLILSGIFFWKSPAYAEGVSLQKVIDEAEAGATLQLENQVYEGDIVITKPLTIIGKDKTVIRGSGKEDVITIEADGVTLKNLTVENSGISLEQDQAAIKVRSNHNQFIGLTIRKSLHGIYFEESNDNQIIDNVIIGHPTLKSPRKGNGIHLFHASNNQIKGNQIYRTRDGIYFSFAENNDIRENVIHDTRYGLHYMYSDHNEFYKNHFYNNVGGAALMYSNNIILRDNKFSDHVGIRSFGVLLQTSNDIVMENNDISFNQKGIFMDQSNRNLIKNNHITHNKIGLVVWTSSINNIFTENRMVENNIQYSTNGANDRNEWSLNKRGNYWSDHTYFDLNQDNVADDAYSYSSSFGKQLSEHQLGYLFLNSPALKIYEHMSGMFKNDQFEIKDPYPMLVNKKTSDWIFYVIIMLVVFSWFYIRKRKKLTEI